MVASSDLSSRVGERSTLLTPVLVTLTRKNVFVYIRSSTPGFCIALV